MQLILWVLVHRLYLHCLIIKVTILHRHFIQYTTFKGAQFVTYLVSRALEDWLIWFLFLFIYFLLVFFNILLPSLLKFPSFFPSFAHHHLVCYFSLCEARLSLLNISMKLTFLKPDTQFATNICIFLAFIKMLIMFV